MKLIILNILFFGITNSAIAETHCDYINQVTGLKISQNCQYNYQDKTYIEHFISACETTLKGVVRNNNPDFLNTLSHLNSLMDPNNSVDISMSVEADDQKEMDDTIGDMFADDEEDHHNTGHTVERAKEAKKRRLAELNTEKEKTLKALQKTELKCELNSEVFVQPNSESQQKCNKALGYLYVETINQCVKQKLMPRNTVNDGKSIR